MILCEYQLVKYRAINSGDSSKTIKFRSCDNLVSAEIFNSNGGKLHLCEVHAVELRKNMEALRIRITERV